MSKVLDLQGVWTAANTDEMKRRGALIRGEIPDKLRESRSAIAAALGVADRDVGIEGRDGTGLKTEIPWVRVYVERNSPSATTGWYVVYLFSASGDRVYLSLNQGTTVWTGSVFKARRSGDLLARVNWVRPWISDLSATRPDLRQSMELGARTPLGKGYEPGNVVAFEYRRDALPDSETLIRDLLFMVSLLRLVYEAERVTPYIPGDPTPEVVEAKRSAEKTAGRRTRERSSGQGFLPTAEERRVVELYGVKLATQYFEARGWTVKDVGAKESYDLLLRRGEERLHVEVKGTTSPGTQVILTRSEVERQRALAPHNALVVIHSIALDRGGSHPSASGGVVHCVSPWQIEEEDLSVVSYIYRTGI